MVQSKAITGRIFSIQRFSLHDGGGTRTTVFLKGCPLSCAWCQNPEGISTDKKPMLFSRVCIGCGACIKASVNKGVQLLDGRIILNCDANENWNDIIYGCPSRALRWDCQDISPEHVMEKIIRDKPFYKYGGGVTLSGGDPLMQPDFCEALLKLCKVEFINTAMETELYTNQNAMERLLPFLDTVYVDAKLFDNEEAKKYTSKNSYKIFSNIKNLLKGPHAGKVIIRTPLIPAITATDSNINSISCFLSSLKHDVPYELLNYNALAPAKYASVGRCYFDDRLQPLSQTDMEHFVEIAKGAGMKNVFFMKGT